MKTPQANKKILRGLVSGLIGVVIALILWKSGALETWEATTWDRRIHYLAKPGKATHAIRLILLDQISLDWGEKVNRWPWPWPRTVFAAIVNYCQRSEVKALAFDVLFTEFSQYGVDDDAALGAAIAKFPNFAGALMLSANSGSESWPDDFPVPEFTIGGLGGWLSAAKTQAIVFPRVELPIPEVAQNSDVLCNVQLKAEDKIFRRLKLFSRFDNKIFPTLGLGTYLAADRDVQMRIETGKLIIGEKSIPIDHAGNAILNYRGPGNTHEFYTAGEILQAELRFINGETPKEKDITIAEDLKDKYVLFGYFAPGLKDLRATPVGGNYAGVEINATVLDNLLSDDFITRVPSWLTIALVCLLALSCGMSASFFNKPLHYVLTGIIFLSIPFLLAAGSYMIHLWLPLAIQLTTAATTILFSLVLDYATEGKQRRFIKHAFKQYLSPAVIEQLIQHPEHLKLGGERKELSIFFSDLQGFTSISEILSPEELTALLNDYLSEMTDIIQQEAGTIDKYEGDAIIAFWNAPLNVPDHALRVVRAALRCQAKLAALRPQFKKRAGKDLLMRIGMNTGPAVVGNMGSHNRFDYTMLGDAVNLAARLEGVNKQFGTYTMISQATRDLIGDEFAVRELARVAVVGRKEPVTVYEPIYWKEYDSHKEILDTFNRGLYLFYDGAFTEALEVFSTIRNFDPPGAAYAEKCRSLLPSQPEAWQGVWVMTTK